MQAPPAAMDALCPKSEANTPHMGPGISASPSLPTASQNLKSWCKMAELKNKLEFS